MRKILGRFLFAALFLSWCVAIYEPGYPEMDYVSVEIYRDLDVNIANEADLRAFLEDKGWVVDEVMSDDQCGEMFPEAQEVCPGGDTLFATATVASGLCGLFGRDKVNARFNTGADGTVVGFALSMRTTVPVKLCRLG